MFKKFAFAFFALITAGMASTSYAQAPAHSNATEVVSSIFKTGTFVGKNKHITTGGISIIKTSSGYIAVLESDFDLDGAPSPTLGFGKNGFDKKSEFTKLNSDKGLQVYAIPANINPADYDEFYVWCADFNVALGVASLN